MMSSENKVWEPIVDARLVEVYGVDVPTLKTNRQGRMTKAQQQRLQRVRWHKIGMNVAIGSVALVMFLALSAIPTEGVLTTVLACPRLILGATVLLQAWFAVQFFWRTSREIATGKVKMYPGRLHRVMWYGSRILFCERGEFYNVPRREWEAFDHHERYRVFCTPHTKVILAAQPVHQDEPLPEAWARGDDPR